MAQASSVVARTKPFCQFVETDCQPDIALREIGAKGGVAVISNKSRQNGWCMNVPRHTRVPRRAKEWELNHFVNVPMLQTRLWSMDAEPGAVMPGISAQLRGQCPGLSPRVH